MTELYNLTKEDLDEMEYVIDSANDVSISSYYVLRLISEVRKLHHQDLSQPDTHLMRQ